jgi:hypothetical protein
MNLASKQDIYTWIKFAKEKKQRFLIVVCDTFDHNDYPVYAKDEEQCKTKFDKYNGKELQRIEEIYDLEKDINEQLQSLKAWHIPWNNN